MKIAFICDIHMPEQKSSIQHAFFTRALERMKQDGIKKVVSVGDISSYGEIGVIEYFMDVMSDFEHHFLLGNAEVRNAQTEEKMLSLSEKMCFQAGNRCVVGINTPYGSIAKADRDRLQSLRDGDILVMHHGPHALDAVSCGIITKLALAKKITIIHAHSHKSFDYKIGKSRVIGLRALDPDKSIGDFPCITYLEISDNDIEVEEIKFSLGKDTFEDIRQYMGLSCADNHKDVDYAIKNKIKFIELRCNGSSWSPDMSLLPKLKKWRRETDGYLSVHMPNIKWDGERIVGEEQWKQAVEYALTIGANGLTMHPPRVKKADFVQGGELWQRYLDLYIYAVKSLENNINVGIENLHMSKAEHALDEKQMYFGYTPQEVSLWIDVINAYLGKVNRVGHVLDVGHARNNGEFYSLYPISRWYELMGKKVVAYHIHQVIPCETGLTNHNAIENWFGPMISYASFFYAWNEGVINHVPVFLEMQGCDNFARSIMSFEKMFKLLY